MKALKIVGGVMAALVVLYFGVGFFLPCEAKVERTVVIDAPVETVFSLLRGPRAQNLWNPWILKKI